MNASLLLQQDAHTGAKLNTTDRGGLAEAQIWGAIIGLSGGVTVAVLGSLMTAAAWLASDAGAKHWLATAGTILLCSTIPLIVLGACCLDWLDKDKQPSESKSARYDDDDEL